MTDPIGTAQERELIEDLRKAAGHVRFSQTGTEASLSKVLTPAADALQSRIAEAEMWKQRAFELECKFGDLKGVYVDGAALSLQR